MIKRYNYEYRIGDYGMVMIESPDGKYVKYEDFQELDRICGKMSGLFLSAYKFLSDSVQKTFMMKRFDKACAMHDKLFGEGAEND